eukprot:TRINITY_DN1046_c0_g1_i1.p1 TRINITY_DN1046_c0_g1~~TRINITY_DN1046_c0_g1_i1.p1  ORF type:complete len:505 (+),score=112.17 TRINITY_DN1046_c0_g1_i1:81-1595(+)
MQDEKEAGGSITVFDDMDKAYDFVENRGIYKYIVLAGTILAYLTHMFLLFSYPFFLIKPTAYCDISGHFRECTKEKVCETTDRQVNYYFKVPHEFNLITEFNWYCESMTSSYYTGTSFFVGTAVSALIVTAVSDAVGRVPLLVTGVIGNIATIVFFMLHATPITCLLTSFFVGFFTMANNSAPFNFLADSVAERYRGVYPSWLNIGWALGEALIAVVMWTQVQWRVMCLIMVLFSAAFFLPLVWLRESPKFYFAQNKLYKARARLEYIASINGASIQKIKLVSPKTYSEKSKEEMGFATRCRLMCCDRHTLIQIVIITFLFTVGNVMFYAASLNIEHMGGNPYIMGITLPVAEIIGCVLSGVLLNKYGARTSLSISFMISSAGVLGLFFLWTHASGSIVFAFVGKLGATALDNSVYTMSGLIFPTEILGGALGVALLGTRLGNSLTKPLAASGPKIMCGVLFVLGVVCIGLSFLVKPREEAPKEEVTKLKETNASGEKANSEGV